MSACESFVSSGTSWINQGRASSAELFSAPPDEATLSPIPDSLYKFTQLWIERKSMSPLYSSRISDFAPRTMKKVGNFLILSFFTTASSDFLTKANLIERLKTESDERALRIVESSPCR